MTNALTTKTQKLLQTALQSDLAAAEMATAIGASGPGATGPTGAAGSAGAAGSTGSAGSTGATGASGNASTETYAASTPGSWNGATPTTSAAAMDRLAAAVKLLGGNP